MSSLSSLRVFLCCRRKCAEALRLLADDETVAGHDVFVGSEVGELAQGLHGGRVAFGDAGEDVPAFDFMRGEAASSFSSSRRSGGSVDDGATPRTFVMGAAAPNGATAAALACLISSWSRPTSSNDRTTWALASLSWAVSARFWASSSTT